MACRYNFLLAVILAFWSSQLWALTESEFDLVLDKVESIYVPIMKSQGQILVFDRYWNEPRIDALSYKMTGKSHVAFYGGLARLKGMTTDIFTTVACHEMGHHLGELGDWRGISPEGEADYYEGLTCLKLVWSKDNNLEIVRGLPVHPKFRDLCDKQYKDVNMSAICQRIGVIALEGETLFALASPLMNPKIKLPNIEVVDGTVVNKTYRGYPLPQCRLDSVLAGALGFSRPRCWFKD